MPATHERDALYFSDRAAWRAWLAEHHAQPGGIWLIYHKKNSATPSVSYVDAVEEALCYGWIDSLAQAIDDTSYRQMFTPRKGKSRWSAVNKARIEKLIAAGLMAAPGLEKIAQAKKDGSWSAYDEIDALAMPTDLQEAIGANDAAQTNFDAFPPSSKKIILAWVASARKPETRAKRIAETVALAVQNIRANHPR